MANFYDAIQKIRNTGPAPAAPSQQQGLEQVALAKGGTAQQGTGPKVSSVGEQAAQQQGQTQFQLQQANTMAAATGLADQAAKQQQAQDYSAQAQQQQHQQGLANLQQKAGLTSAQNQQTFQQGSDKLEVQGQLQKDKIRAGAQQELMKLAADNEATTDNVFRSFRAGTQELQDRRDAADLEQVAFLYSMQDKSYLDQLQRIGQQRQLYDTVAFKNEANQIVRGQELDALIRKLGLQQQLGEGERASRTAVANLDIDSALAMARAVSASSSAQNIISGTTSAVRSGLDYADRQQDKAATQQPAAKEG